MGGNQSGAKLVATYIPLVVRVITILLIIFGFKQDVKKIREHGSIEARKATSIHQDNANNYKEFQYVFQVKQMF